MCEYVCMCGSVCVRVYVCKCTRVHVCTCDVVLCSNTVKKLAFRLVGHPWSRLLGSTALFVNY